MVAQLDNQKCYSSNQNIILITQIQTLCRRYYYMLDETTNAKSFKSYHNRVYITYIP